MGLPGGAPIQDLGLMVLADGWRWQPTVRTDRELGRGTPASNAWVYRVRLLTHKPVRNRQKRLTALVPNPVTMSGTDYRDLVEGVIEDNSYLTLATTDGDEPWAAPVEYIRDESGTFYFFSPAGTRHARHIQENETVGVAIFGPEQPEYTPDISESLNGVQIRGRARMLEEDEYPDPVAGAIEALDPPMPPYEAFAIEPLRAYAPVIEDGVNKRVEVELE